MRHTISQIARPTPIALILMVFFVCIAAVSYADVMPSFDRLQPVNERLNAPSAIAFNQSENLYVAESGRDMVLVFSPGGKHLRTLSGLHKPISLAVGSGNRIIVGNAGTGSVEVYSPDLRLLLTLGQGNNEFSTPGAIAVDSSGNIYVADTEEDEISVYDPQDGSHLFSFGTSGSSDGQFNMPTAIAIDDIRGEIIITDLKMISGMMGTRQGARVQVFDLTALTAVPLVPLRSFGTFGVGEGKLYKPKGVAVDELGRIYVTDSHQQVVQVFDGNGVYLGTIYDLNTPMRTPSGIALGKSNRLFAASMNGSRVDVYGIDSYEQMDISPLALEFEAQQGGNAPDLQNIDITNNGLITLNWTASTTDAWITLSDEAGLAEPALSSSLGVGVNIGGLTTGTYSGSVQITADSGATESVSVTLTITAPAELSVTPLSLVFTSKDGSTPTVQGLSIDNTGEGTLDWTASSASAWLLIDKASGTTPDTINAAVNIASLSAGTYYGSITITSAGAVGSPANIPVKLDVIVLEGTINVTINPTNLAEATFNINGPASYSGSGTNWSVTNAPAGTYIIVFGDVAGYIKPALYSQELQPEGTITFSGTYEQEVKPVIMNSIIVGAGPGSSNAGVVKVFNPDGSAGAEFTAHGYNYGVEVAAGDIDGDGIDEIITAPGPGADNPAEINVFDANGNELPDLGITAFALNYGAYIASADFNNDGQFEVITGAGAGVANPAEVKVFVYDPLTDSLTDSGIDLLAYGTKYGVRVAAGDIDGDGIPEIVTAPGPGWRNRGVIRIWKVDTSLGKGQWSTSFVGEFTVKSRYRYSVSIACGDTNGDGADEIITGAGPHRRAKDAIRVFNMNGTRLARFRANISNRYGANVAAGDINGDEVDEIIIGAGPYTRNMATVKVYNKFGMNVRFNAMKSTFGANVASGNLGFEGAK